MNNFLKSDLFLKFIFLLFFIFIAITYAELIGFQNAVLVFLVLIWTDVTFKD